MEPIPRTNGQITPESTGFSVATLAATFGNTKDLVCVAVVPGVFYINQATHLLCFCVNPSRFFMVISPGEIHHRKGRRPIAEGGGMSNEMEPAWRPRQRFPPKPEVAGGTGERHRPRARAEALGRSGVPALPFLSSPCQANLAFS